MNDASEQSRVGVVRTLRELVTFAVGRGKVVRQMLQPALPLHFPSVSSSSLYTELPLAMTLKLGLKELQGEKARVESLPGALFISRALKPPFVKSRSCASKRISLATFWRLELKPQILVAIRVFSQMITRCATRGSLRQRSLL